MKNSFFCCCLLILKLLQYRLSIKIYSFISIFRTVFIVNEILVICALLNNENLGPNTELDGTQNVCPGIFLKINLNSTIKLQLAVEKKIYILLPISTSSAVLSLRVGHGRFLVRIYFQKPIRNLRLIDGCFVVVFCSS